jgi:hypothetical protein
MGNLSLSRYALANPFLTFAALSIILIFGWKINAYVKARKYKLPPRVPGIPIFGNTFQLPPLKQGLWGIETAKKYGEM